MLPDEKWDQYEADGYRWFQRQADGAWAWEREFQWEVFEDPMDQRRWRYNKRMNRPKKVPV